MIFLTTGTQLPFDRLVKEVDEWAGARNKEVFAQIGYGKFRPKHIVAVPHLEPQEFNNKMREAKAIISHAGMGTILTALQLGKPIVIMPRLVKYKEHRNDHQLATARALQGRAEILIAVSETELGNQLDKLGNAAAIGCISQNASDGLLRGIRSFIEK